MKRQGSSFKLHFKRYAALAGSGDRQPLIQVASEAALIAIMVQHRFDLILVTNRLKAVVGIITNSQAYGTPLMPLWLVDDTDFAEVKDLPERLSILQNLLGDLFVLQTILIRCHHRYNNNSALHHLTGRSTLQINSSNRDETISFLNVMDGLISELMYVTSILLLQVDNGISLSTTVRTPQSSCLF